MMRLFECTGTCMGRRRQFQVERKGQESRLMLIGSGSDQKVLSFFSFRHRLKVCTVPVYSTRVRGW